MPANAVAQLFSQLEGVLLDSAQGKLSSSLVKRTVSLADQFIATFKQYPDVMMAQPLLYKQAYSFELNLLFNGCVYLAMLCESNKVNATTTGQMICSLISLHSERIDDLKQFYLTGEAPLPKKRNNRLIEVLTASQQQVWLRGYQLFDKLGNDKSGFQSQWPLGLSKVQKIVMLSHLLAVHMTPNRKTAPAPFSQIFRQLVQSLPSDWLNEVKGLLDYPGLICPGTLVKSGSKSLLVLSVSRDKALVREVQSGDQANTPVTRIYLRNIDKLYAPQKIKGFSQIEQWWDGNWQAECLAEPVCAPTQSLYKLDQPPSTLLEVQKHLSSQDIDIDKLANMISEEPAFAEFITLTASHSNRNKLPVQQVKHGLMMHGYERTSSMLIQQALLLRLNQSYFPLQQEFIQFTRLRAKISELLSAFATTVTVEQAATLTCFACSGLFTQPGPKGRRHWQLKQTNQQDIRSLFLFANADNLHHHSMTLAKAWQQSKYMINGLQFHFLFPEAMATKKSSKELAIILGLSLIRARQVYFNEPILCEETRTYLNQGLAYLKISASDFNALGEQALTLSHCYCALN